MLSDCWSRPKGDIGRPFPARRFVAGRPVLQGLIGRVRPGWRSAIATVELGDLELDPARTIPRGSRGLRRGRVACARHGVAEAFRPSTPGRGAGGDCVSKGKAGSALAWSTARGRRLGAIGLGNRGRCFCPTGRGWTNPQLPWLRDERAPPLRIRRTVDDDPVPARTSGRGTLDPGPETQVFRGIPGGSSPRTYTTGTSPTEA